MFYFAEECRKNEEGCICKQIYRMVGFLWKGEREMKRQDKLSVLLMLGILCLVLVNAGAIYHMWLNGEGKLAEMKGEDPEKRSELIFHDDTSITSQKRIPDR